MRKGNTGADGKGAASGMQLPAGMDLPKDFKMPSGAGGGMGATMGGEASSAGRLFSSNSLSDQIIWLFPLAIFGFLAAAIKEKFKNPFNKDRRKLSLILWIMWLVPVFAYFSITTGMFHPYYLTMLAPPIAALAGIGIVSMWELYKENSWKSWLLPAAFIVDGSVQLLILSYFLKTSSITKILMIGVSILCFVSSIILIIVKLKKNENVKLKKILVITAMIGVLITPAVWSGTTMFYPVDGTMPSAGLELTSSKNGAASFGMGDSSGSNTKLIEFLKTHNTNEKYFLTVSTSSGTGSDIIINSGEPVMSLGGFMGSDKILTLDEFKNLVAKGEVRYVMSGGMMGGGSTSTSVETEKNSKVGSKGAEISTANKEDTTTNENSQIMAWIAKVGEVVPESEWKSTTKSTKTSSNAKSSESNNQQLSGFLGANSGKLYDLKTYTDTVSKK